MPKWYPFLKRIAPVCNWHDNTLLFAYNRFHPSKIYYPFFLLSFVRFLPISTLLFLAPDLWRQIRRSAGLRRDLIQLYFLRLSFPAFSSYFCPGRIMLGPFSWLFHRLVPVAVTGTSLFRLVVHWEKKATKRQICANAYRPLSQSLSGFIVGLSACFKIISKYCFQKKREEKSD